MGASIDLVAGESLAIPNGKQWPAESTFWIVHTVQAGQTLVELSSLYDLTTEEILRVNAIADPALIHIDQQLVIPLTQLVTSPPPSPPTATPVGIASAPQSKPAENASSTPVTETALEPAQSNPPPPAPPAGPGEWSGYILARINQVRAEHGLHPLTLVPALSQAAQVHAQDCAQRGWGSHVGSDGARLATRLERAGYTGPISGENWVQALNAERAFEWWYGEIPPNDPHRRNILSPRYTEIGIGIADMSWGYIFVTDFGKR
jgi:uncharacterized protein YkwD